MSEQVDFDDIYKFAKEQFGIRPTPLQLQMIRHVMDGKNVTVMRYARATGKTTATKLAVEYMKFLKKIGKST